MMPLGYVSDHSKICGSLGAATLCCNLMLGDGVLWSRRRPPSVAYASATSNLHLQPPWLSLMGGPENQVISLVIVFGVAVWKSAEHFNILLSDCRGNSERVRHVTQHVNSKLIMPFVKRKNARRLRLFS